MTRQFVTELKENLTENILPYWVEKMQDPEGGFYGECDFDDNLHKDAPRGAILNARILWTFSAAARVLGNEEYKKTAERQFQYIRDHFIDPEYGGVYWSINADGTPCDTKKQFYAIAFTIYGLAEYCRLTGSEEAKNLAVELFRIIEKYSRDRERGGYIEALTREWQPIADMRLSDKDLNSSKTMNTHLHILEAYTALVRVWRTEESIEAATSLLRLFNSVIVSPHNHHLGLFFDDNLKRVELDISYGHDIEASWLMLESAHVIGDKELLDETINVTYHLGHAALEGKCVDGSMVYERYASGRYNNQKHWWVQAENVIGQLYLAIFHNEPEMLKKAYQSWQYIDNNIVDKGEGEWYWGRNPDGSLMKEDKAGFWKCPYHNSRMCLEAIERLNSNC